MFCLENISFVNQMYFSFNRLKSSTVVEDFARDYATLNKNVLKHRSIKKKKEEIGRSTLTILSSSWPSHVLWAFYMREWKCSPVPWNSILSVCTEFSRAYPRQPSDSDEQAVRRIVWSTPKRAPTRGRFRQKPRAKERRRLCWAKSSSGFSRSVPATRKIFQLFRLRQIRLLLVRRAMLRRALDWKLI